MALYNASREPRGCGILRLSAAVFSLSTIVGIAALLAFGPSQDATAATLTVVNTNDSGPGSLRQAIADAGLGDTIGFDGALSGQTVTLTSGELLISQDLTITGPVGGITISGNNASRVFEISSGIVSMSNLTVTGGNSVGQDGGGILNYDRLTLTDSTITGNSAEFGGGIFIGGSLTLANSIVSSNNSTRDGGGIYLYFGSMIITNSTIDGNTSDRFGGGIYSRGNVTLTDSTVSGNTTSQSGGGITKDSGTLSLTNSTVSENRARASLGGGIASYGVGALTLTNSTVSGNTSVRGGGIYSGTADTIITNSTIDSNSAGGRGGGILNDRSITITNSTVSRNTSGLRDGGGIYSLNGPLTLVNSTVSENGAPQGSGGGIFNEGATTLINSIVANQAAGTDCSDYPGGGAIVSGGYNLDSDGTCYLTATGDLPNTSPSLKPLALNAPGNTETQALTTLSPAIDRIPAGVNGCGTTISADQRGVSRPQGSGCDIGAYELGEPPPTPPPTPTPTPPTMPAPVGGLVILPVSGASGSGWLAWLIALVGAAVTLMAVGWWHRRRTLG